MPELNIIYSVAKNNEKTCSLDGKFFHSKYNPSAEAVKFVQNLQADFEPLCVFIIEPALSYCVDELRVRFPNSNICAIRIINEFKERDIFWDKVFYFSNNLSNDLYNSLGEEKLCSSLFFDWTASKNIICEKTSDIWNNTWNEIKSAIIKSRDVMLTRAYFSKRWLKNFSIFAKNIKKTAFIKQNNSNKPIIIAASGTSLKTSLPYLRKFRDKYFLIAVSSAFMPIVKFGIKPDFVISTDGGYWAKKHLLFSKKQVNEADILDNTNHFFALSMESSVPNFIFKNESIISLLYDDCTDFQRYITKKLGIKTVLARRNGTVSGTALELAMNLTSNAIFLCGLDQAPSPEYQHTQPNALEFNSQQYDFRLKTKETRLTTSRFNSQNSLEIYRNWFISNSKKFNSPKERIFRLSDNFSFSFDLGYIKDKNWSDFEKIIDNNQTITNIEIESEILQNKNDDSIKSEILTELKKSFSDEKFINEVFPMDSLLLKREKSEEKRLQIKANLKEKQNKLLKEIERII